MPKDPINPIGYVRARLEIALRWLRFRLDFHLPFGTKPAQRSDLDRRQENPALPEPAPDAEPGIDAEPGTGIALDAITIYPSENCDPCEWQHAVGVGRALKARKCARRKQVQHYAALAKLTAAKSRTSFR